MNDKECLLQICAHLGLWEIPASDEDPTAEQYQAMPGVDGQTEIILGCGGGDEGSTAFFAFNKDGCCTEHYVFDKS